MKNNIDISEKILNEAQVGTWPLLPKERNWGTIGLLGVMISGGVAAWSYSIGGYVAYYLNAAQGTVTMVAGSLVGIFWVVLACIPVSVRYGIDSVTASRPQFGSRGSYLAILLQYASIIGWNLMLLIIFGRAAASVFITMGWAGEPSRHLLAVAFSEAAVFLSWWLLKGGADAVRKHSFVIAILVTALSAFIMIRIITAFGIKQLLSAPPLAPSEDQLYNYVVGFEILVASVLSWWPYMGGVTRMVAKTKMAAWPAVWGMGLPTGVISFIGLYSALIIGDSDPSVFLLNLGGPLYGIFALLFIALANIGTAIVGAYCTGMGLKQISFFKKQKWSVTSFIVLLPVFIIATLMPDLIMAHIGTFLAWLGVVFGPVCAIQTTDYYLLRKQRLNMIGLYDNSPESPYYFYGGINPAAIIAFICGCCTCVYLLNPLTFESHALFRYISASLPAIIVTGAVYYVLSKLFIVKSAKGDYRCKESAGIY